MAHDGISLACSALESVAFLGFRGTERISQPYEYELFFTVPTGTDVRKAVGERATLRASHRAGSDPLIVHGVIAGVRLLHQTAERALYQALLVPKLWLLRHFFRSYVFTNQPVKEILAATLQSGGLTASEIRFSIHEDDYPTEEFVAQYRETHLAFFHRWLEREGLYYFFEHPEDGANEVLVIVDDRGVHSDFPGSGRARYIPIVGDDATAPAGLHHLEQDVQWLPKSVTIADFNYANPSASVKGESSITANGRGAIREYGYRVFVQSDAERLARVRAQSIGCREVTLRASGDVLGPRAGFRLSLDDQPGDIVEEWLALEVEHAGSIAGITSEVARLTGLSSKHTYRIKLLAIPAEMQFRAPQATPWPRIYGFENAIVCGPADSEYAQLDADGRYLVRFEFDTSGLPDERISTRVRMMQPHGGTVEGFHFPLRKGTEVMIGFLGGDPDRPFIAGVVPNAHRPSVVGERNNSQNIIRTGSGNQLVLEDERGKEFIYIHTPNNRTSIYMGYPSRSHASVYTGEGETEVGSFMTPGNANPDRTRAIAERSVTFSYFPATIGNAGFWVGGDLWENVQGSKYVFVSDKEWVGIGGEYALEIGGDAEETYYAKSKVTIKGGRVDRVEAGGMQQTIFGGMEQIVFGNYNQDIESQGKQKVNGTWEHRVKAQNSDQYGSWKTDVKATWTAKFGGDVSLKSATNFLIEAPEAKIKAQSAKWEVLGASVDLVTKKHELYGYKGASGALKVDHAVVSHSVVGLKVDFTALKVDRTFAKYENTPLKRESFSVDVKSAGVVLCNLGVSFINAALMRF